MKKMIKTLVGVFLVFVLFSPTSDAAVLNGKLGEVNFSTNDYDNEDVEIRYYNIGNKKVCEIKDEFTGQVLETISLEPDFSKLVSSKSYTMSARSSGWTAPHTLRRAKSYGRTVVEISIPIELYNNGSFRQVNYIGQPYLGIKNSITSIVIESSSSSAWALNNRLPTTSVLYAYYGTLTASVSSSSSSGLSGELLGAGFSFSHSVGTTKYYRRSIRDSGSINLY